MQQLADFFTHNWAQLLFGLVAAVVIGFTYYFVRRERSEYLSKAAITVGEGPKLNEAIFRHIVTAITGLMIMWGWFTESVGAEFIGALMLIFTLVLSFNGIDKQTLVDKIMGIGRHLVSFLGGIGIIAGQSGQDKWMTYVGIVATVIGVVWSLFDKKAKMKMT